MIQFENDKEKLYKFRGKTFPASPATIKQLNYALALNRSSERYVLVGDIPKTAEDNTNGK